MGVDIRKILELAPIAIGAMKPGSPEMAAMMRGYMRSQAQIQQQQQAQGQNQRQARLDELSASNLLADNKRQDQSAQLQREQFDLNKLEKFRTAGAERGQALVAGADLNASPTDPSLQNQLATDLFGLSQQYGVDPAAAQTVMPNTTAQMSARKKKHAKELYEQAKARFSTKDGSADWENSITLQTDAFGPIKPADLRSLFEMPAFDPAGMPAQPPAPPDPEAKTLGSFDAHFGDVLGAEEAKLGRKLTRTERVPIRLKAKKDYDASNDRPLREARERYSVQPVTKPDGSTGLVRVNLDTGAVDPLNAEGMAFGKPTDAQRGAKAFYDRAAAADETAASFEDDLATLGPQLAAKLPNILTSEAGQRYVQAQREFTEARLRKESGAAIPPEEFVNDAKTYFAQPGDTAATIEQKQTARQRVKRGLKQQSGNLGALQDNSVEQWVRDPKTGKLVKKGTP